MTIQPLIVNEWKAGIADSPHEGIGLLRCVDIESFPSAVKVKAKTTSLFDTLTQAFTANAGTDICTLTAGTIPRTGIAVTFTTTGTLPAGLSLSTIYFLRRESSTTFKVATSLAISASGTVVDITDAGTGTHTVTAVSAGQVNHIEKDYVAAIGAYQYFMQDSNARVWWHLPSAFGGTFGGGTFLLSGNTLTDGSGNGLVLFTTSNGQDRYLLAFRDYKVDAVNVRILPVYTWSNDWKSSMEFMTTDFSAAVTNTLQAGGRVNPVGSEEPVLIASAQSSGAGSASSLSFSITVPSGYSDMSVVVISGVAGTDANGVVTGVTFDSSAMTGLQAGAADSRFDIRSYVAPGVGSKTVVVTYTGAVVNRWAQAFIFAKSHQTTPFTASSVASGGAVTTLNQPITTTAANQLPLSLTFSNGAATHTPRSPQVPIIESTSLFSAASVFSSSFFSMATFDDGQHYAIRAEDNIVYFCNWRLIGSIQETSAKVFNPSDSTTYTFTYNALDLPVNEISEWLEELGSNLMIAGGATNKIYPWDRTSDSFNIPLEVPEVGVKRLKNNGGQMYILAGTKGNIYKTQGTYVQFVKKLPDYVVNNSGTLQASVVTWGGISTLNGGIIFGAGVLTSGNSGVYLLQPDGELSVDNIPSTGSANATAIMAVNEFYLLGYSGGADIVDTSRYSSFQGVIHSALYRVATKVEKGAYSEIEIVTAKPATTGNIRVGYRTNTSGSFTTLITSAADSATTIFTDDIGLTDLDDVQFQVEMDGDIELVELRLMP